MDRIKNTAKLGALLPLLGILAVYSAGETRAAQEANQPRLASVITLLESGSNPVRIVCFGDSIQLDIELELGVRRGGVGHDSDSAFGDKTGTDRRRDPAR